MSTSTAMVVSGEHPPEQPRHLAPGSFGEVIEWAKFIADSGLAPAELHGKWEKVAVVLLSGAEQGIPPMMAMRVLPVIKNKVSQTAEHQLARCLASPVCEYFTCLESTATKATYQAKRVGAPGPVTHSYTMAEAVAAGAGDMYRKHPAAMLRARASSGLARMVFADVIGGLYTREELDDGQPEVTRPAPIVATPIPVMTEDPVAPRFTVEATPEVEHISQAAARAPEAPSAIEAARLAANDALDVEIAALRGAIETAAEPANLDALLPRLRKLPKADQFALRPAFDARMAKVTKKEPAAETTGAAS